MTYRSWVTLMVLAGTCLTASAGSVGDHVDFQWFRQKMLDDHAAHYLQHSPTSNGFLVTRLDQTWNADTSGWGTLVSQNRALFTLSVGAYVASDAEGRSQYLTEVAKGADFLLTYPADDVYGGYIHGFNPDGSWFSGNWPWDNLKGKDALGLGQTMFGLTHAYRMTGDSRYLDGAWEAWDALDQGLRDTATSGGFHQGANRDYSQLWPAGQPNLNHMMHIFEPLMEMYAVEGDPGRKAQLKSAAEEVGDFIVTVMYRDHPTQADRGYIPDKYDASWTAPPDGYVNAGHNIETTFLLSRAVQLGLKDADPNAWLDPAKKVQNFVLAHAYDHAGDGGIYSKFDYDGTNLEPSWSKGSWEQCETLRALMHWAEVRGESSYWPLFDETLQLAKDHFIDETHGSWGPYDLPDDYSRGAWWGGGYHQTMMYLEALRLSHVPGDATADGLVDVGDLGVLAGNWGAVDALGWVDGDFNDDRIVDVGDLGILAGNWSQGTTGVPEPTSLLLAGGLLAGAAARRRRYRVS
jgi:mannose/cellobiose epimerase-like protein (N-acyl-D-glucosamine 2-epimerase family)